MGAGEIRDDERDKMGRLFRIDERFEARLIRSPNKGFGCATKSTVLWALEKDQYEISKCWEKFAWTLAL